MPELFTPFSISTTSIPINNETCKTFPLSAMFLRDNCGTECELQKLVWGFPHKIHLSGFALFRAVESNLFIFCEHQQHPFLLVYQLTLTCTVLSFYCHKPLHKISEIIWLIINNYILLCYL